MPASTAGNNFASHKLHQLVGFMQNGSCDKYVAAGVACSLCWMRAGPEAFRGASRMGSSSWPRLPSSRRPPSRASRTRSAARGSPWSCWRGAATDPLRRAPRCAHGGSHGRPRAGGPAAPGRGGSLCTVWESDCLGISSFSRNLKLPAKKGPPRVLRRAPCGAHGGSHGRPRAGPTSCSR